jgi:hypothetical protein
MVDVRNRPRVADVMNELESFHRFLGDQLAHGDSMLTPEECLELWRAQNLSDDEREAEAQAVREAIDDMRAGDAGQPLQEFLAEFRARKNILS